MQTWSDIHFSLTPADQPIISAHRKSVTFGIPGYMSDGRGFIVELTRAHLDVLHCLIAALESLPSVPDDTDPF